MMDEGVGVVGGVVGGVWAEVGVAAPTAHARWVELRVRIGQAHTHINITCILPLHSNSYCYLQVYF